MYWKFLSTGRRREENRVNERFTSGAPGRVPHHAATGARPKTMREQTRAMP
jgi:hypothetical protein